MYMSQLDGAADMIKELRAQLETVRADERLKTEASIIKWARFGVSAPPRGRVSIYVGDLVGAIESGAYRRKAGT